jgi:hypothetical protein
MAYRPFRRLVAKCGLLAALPLFLATANAQQPVAVVIHEYPAAVVEGLIGARAGPIASGSDGALWFPVGSTSFDGNSVTYQILRTTTTGVVTTYAGGVGGVGGITSGPVGALWYTSSSYGYANSGYSIYRLTTSGESTAYPLTNADATPTAITTGPDGALWFTEPIQDIAGSAIGRITTSGVFTSIPFRPSPLSLRRSLPDRTAHSGFPRISQARSAESRPTEPRLASSQCRHSAFTLGLPLGLTARSGLSSPTPNRSGGSPPRAH